MRICRTICTVIAISITLAVFSDMALAYTISGTVNYSGSNSGRIYLYLDGSSGLGTSVASAGSSFTIRGVPNGSYTLYAFMDRIGNGLRHAADPVGSLGSITVSGDNLSSKNIALSDPSPVTPAAPGWVQASPASGGAFIQWDSPKDQNGTQVADSYSVYWSNNSSFTPGMALGSKTGILASDNNFFIKDSLTNGNTYYFLVTAKTGSATSASSAISAPVTIGTPSGGYNVSVPVTLTNFSNPGPLYLAISDDAGKMFFSKITNPASGTYTVAGVQNGTYYVYSFIDMNNNGILDQGDISHNGNAPLVTVNDSAVTAPSSTLNAVNAKADVQTTHYSSGGIYGYNLNFDIQGKLKQAVGVTLTAGPAGISYPTDIAISRDGSDFNFWANSVARPSTSDVYTFTINYSDGSSDTGRQAAVTGVLDAFPSPLSPIGNIGGPGSTAPTFAWLPPASLPSGDYSYTMWLSAQNSGNIWYVDSMPNTQTRAAYNFDGNADQQSLTVGTTYYWGIAIQDSNGNKSESQTAFTVTTGAISFTGSVVDSINHAISGASVILDGYPSVTTITADNGTFTLSGLPSGSPFVLKVTKSGYQPAYSQYLVSTSNMTNATPIKLFTQYELSNYWGVTSGKGAIVAVVTDSYGLTGGAVVTATSAANGSYPVTYFDGSNFGGSSTYASTGLAFAMNVNDGDSVLLQASKSGLSFGYAIVPTHADSVSEALLFGSPQLPQQNSLSVTVTGNGSVYSSPSGISCDSGTCTAQFDAGSSVTLTATASSGSIFSGWSGACTNTSGNCVLTMNDDKSVTALFETTPPVRIEGGSYFDTLQQAFDSTTNSSFTVLAQDTELNGSLAAQNNNTINFKGGYDSSFNQKLTGGYTSITGILTLINGSLTVNDLIIK